MFTQPTADDLGATRQARAAATALTACGRSIGLSDLPDQARPLIKELHTITYRLAEVLVAVDHAMAGHPDRELVDAHPETEDALSEAAAAVAEAKPPLDRVLTVLAGGRLEEVLTDA